ncbi:MAG TPA: hypothetical protein VF893_04660 [Candidatus Bathyarchaeia archaeon]
MGETKNLLRRFGEAAIKKVFSIGGGRAKKSVERDVSFEKVDAKNKDEEPKQPDLEQEIGLEWSPAEEPTPKTQAGARSSSKPNAFSSDARPASKRKASHELEIGCLVCEDLVHCEIRNPTRERCSKQKHGQS